MRSASETTMSRFLAVLALLLILFSAMVVVPRPASANPDTCTWNNATANGLWGTAGNWSCGHAPANGDDVVFSAVSNTPVSVNVLTANLLTVSVNAGYLSTITVNVDQCTSTDLNGVCLTGSTWGAVT